MALNVNNLILIGGEGKKYRQYMYLNPNGDDISATGYFANTNLRVGTQILELTETGYTTRENYYISAKSGMNSTATASTEGGVSAEASKLTGTTLASNVVSSSLTSVGTLTSLTSSGTITADTITDGTATLTGGALTGATTGAFSSDVSIGGILKIPDGSVTTPSLAFTSDPDTGMYFQFSQIKFAFGGSAKVLIGDTKITIGAGNIGEAVMKNTGMTLPASPAYTFGSDEDTGMYRSFTNEISFATNGTQAVKIDATQGLSILGTTDSTSTTTGALKVSGGGAFVKSVNIGEDLTVGGLTKIILPTTNQTAGILWNNAGTVSVGTL